MRPRRHVLSFERNTQYILFRHRGYAVRKGHLLYYLFNYYTYVYYYNISRPKQTYPVLIFHHTNLAVLEKK